jgi:nanoRNase/pAp phosphatase (c-di-AMP/oligoRNAs hydrolase)
VLLGQVNNYDMKFVHPKDMQDGTVTITDNDILTNVPHVAGCGMWFDHHASEVKRAEEEGFAFKGEARIADSAARVVYEYFGGQEKFGAAFDSIMAGVDKADAAKFSKEDILEPQGWDLLSFIMDSRTRPIYKDSWKCHYYRSPQRRDHLSWQPVYALYPEQNISMWIVDGFQKQNCAIACGHSIINKSAQAHVGFAMREYGGGGHQAAGTCQVAYDDADRVIDELIQIFQ